MPATSRLCTKACTVRVDIPYDEEQTVSQKGAPALVKGRGPGGGPRQPEDAWGALRMQLHGKIGVLHQLDEFGRGEVHLALQLDEINRVEGLSLGSILVPKNVLLLHGGDDNGRSTGDGAIAPAAGRWHAHATTRRDDIGDAWPAEHCCTGPNAVVLRSTPDEYSKQPKKRRAATSAKPLVPTAMNGTVINHDSGIRCLRRSDGQGYYPLADDGGTALFRRAAPPAPTPADEDAAATELLSEQPPPIGAAAPSTSRGSPKVEAEPTSGGTPASATATACSVRCGKCRASMDTSQALAGIAADALRLGCPAAAVPGPSRASSPRAARTW